MDIDALISDRARAVDTSGIRRVFNLAATLKDPINLSIGQPDFAVPAPVKKAAIAAIESDRNGYTLTQGVAALRARIAAALRADVGWDVEEADTGLLVTSGTSGALLLAFLSLLAPGDEVVIPDPYFVIYPHQARMCSATPVLCDIYPDFLMTPEKVEPLLTPRTKAVVFNSPGNPTGAVASRQVCQGLLELCRARGIVLISDEIYDEFVYTDGLTDAAAGNPRRRRCPSPARLPDASADMLLIRGFGKSYGCTGWRMGYAAGPKALIDQMTKLQQYTFVCAPAPAQHGCIAAFDADISEHVAEYESRRDLVVERLRRVTEVSSPAGAFYAFPRVPEALGLTGTAFVEKCIERGVLAIPGAAFSSRDTHIRVSYATRPVDLERGLDIIEELMRG